MKSDKQKIHRKLIFGSICAFYTIDINYDGYRNAMYMKYKQKQHKHIY